MTIEIGARLLTVLVILAVVLLIERWWHYASRAPRR